MVRRRLVNVYEVKTGMTTLQGKAVDHTLSERFCSDVHEEALSSYTNVRPYLSFLITKFNVHAKRRLKSRKKTTYTHIQAYSNKLTTRP